MPYNYNCTGSRKTYGCHCASVPPAWSDLGPDQRVRCTCELPTVHETQYTTPQCFSYNVVIGGVVRNANGACVSALRNTYGFQGRVSWARRAFRCSTGRIIRRTRTPCTSIIPGYYTSCFVVLYERNNVRGGTVTLWKMIISRLRTCVGRSVANTRTYSISGWFVKSYNFTAASK